ncbi:MAG: HEAT repeat domain-containing protein [Cyanobacteriota bacterium]|nr:HEAT repeat domain-containing protein [Cyanobacteriota bacterium]
MNKNQNQPREFDVVLGGENPAPVTGVVLGGIEGIKQRLESEIADVIIKALYDALNYGDEGLDLIIKALRNNSKVLQRNAYKILRKREETQVKRVLKEYKPWYLSERLQTYNNLDAKARFANLQVVNYNPKIGIKNPENTAYALTCHWSHSIHNDIKAVKSLSKKSQSDKLEAIVIFVWDSPTERYSKIVNALINAKARLVNLKALYIGCPTWKEIEQSDISPILTAYPQLEILQISARYGLKIIEPVEHKNLRGLIVRSLDFNQDTLTQLDKIKLPALEHFEWLFNNQNNNKKFSIKLLKPILVDLIFPDLNYLGFRGSEFADEIAEAIVKSPLIKTISILDLSGGNLTDKGAETLLNCAAVNELDILNVSENYLSEEMIDKLSALDCKLLAEKSPPVIRCGTMSRYQNYRLIN